MGAGRLAEGNYGVKHDIRKGSAAQRKGVPALFSTMELIYAQAS